MRETRPRAGVAAPIARRVFDYVLLGQYPSEEDMLAVQAGRAAAPIGKPRLAAEMNALLVDDTPGGSSSAAAQKAEPASRGSKDKALQPAKPAKAAKAAANTPPRKTSPAIAPATQPN